MVGRPRNNPCPLADPRTSWLSSKAFEHPVKAIHSGSNSLCRAKHRRNGAVLAQDGRRRDVNSNDRLQEIFISNSILKDQAANPSAIQQAPNRESSRRTAYAHYAESSKEESDDTNFVRKIQQTEKTQEGPKDWIYSTIEALDRSVNRQDRSALSQLIPDVRRLLSRPNADWDSSKVELILAKFLSACFALRAAETAVEVWNLMISANHPISLSHWTAMLHGCTRAQDIQSMEVIWNNMQKSDVQPDNIAWAAYIRGLIKCGKSREGLEALNGLGRYWVHRAQDPSAGPTRQPSLPPINATLDALVDVEKYEVLGSVLDWARRFRIRFDTKTYNILLRPLAWAGDMQGIQKHLNTMVAEKCLPDITTFTIITSTVISSPESAFRDLPPKAQESSILSLLHLMEIHGVSPNVHTYSTIISALLKLNVKEENFNDDTESSGFAPLNKSNVTIALAVLAHMQSRSIQPTPHIFTSLLNYFFSLKPPDLVAIRTLWTSISTSRQLTDTIIYDRMIEGLSDADQLDDAMALIKRMVREGKAPGWWALGRYLDALCRAEDWRAVRWIVKEVEKGDRGTLMKWGQRGFRAKGKWERTLIQLRDMGVLEEKS